MRYYVRSSNFEKIQWKSCVLSGSSCVVPGEGVELVDLARLGLPIHIAAGHVQDLNGPSTTGFVRGGDGGPSVERVMV